MLAIETNKLTKYYGEYVGIKDVSLEIEKGEVFGFIGPNYVYAKKNIAG
ncbi:MAG: hypothetical protein MK078_11060 [Crocinitomicaceae bacterium]|nr:hypothetical protein [Crocinitomicaceae bacterium]